MFTTQFDQFQETSQPKPSSIPNLRSATCFLRSIAISWDLIGPLRRFCLSLRCWMAWVSIRHCSWYFVSLCLQTSTYPSRQSKNMFSVFKKPRACSALQKHCQGLLLGQHRWLRRERDPMLRSQIRKGTLDKRGLRQTWRCLVDNPGATRSECQLIKDKI